MENWVQFGVTLFHLSTWSEIRILPLFLSLLACLFLSFLANLSTLTVYLFFLLSPILSIDLSRRRGYSNLLGFFLRRVKEETKNIFISSVFVLDWPRRRYFCKSHTLKKVMTPKTGLTNVIQKKTRYMSTFDKLFACSFITNKLTDINTVTGWWWYIAR